MRMPLFFFVWVALLGAQEVRSATDRASVRVHGEATVSAEPDQAEIDIGVVTQASTTEAASTQNAQQANAVMQSLHAIAPSATIKTVNLSINPNFRYPKEGSPVITSYTANNTVQVTVDDVSILRKIIEAAIKAGATSINRLNYTLKSEKAVRARALGQAADQAKASAEALAASLELKLGRILQVEEGQPVIVSPAPEIDFGKIRSTDMTPISPGNIQVHANVNLTYELLQ